MGEVCTTPSLICDIDGVFISYLDLKKIDVCGRRPFEKEATECANALLDYYGASLFMISSVNTEFYSNPDSYREWLLARGLRVPKVFGLLDHVDRVKSVKEHRKKYPNYLIIDDEPFHYYQDSTRKLDDCLDYRRILAPNSYRCLDRFDIIKYLPPRGWDLNKM
jgi:hypothetical protein